MPPRKIENLLSISYRRRTPETQTGFGTEESNRIILDTTEALKSYIESVGREANISYKSSNESPIFDRISESAVKSKDGFLSANVWYEQSGITVGMQWGRYVREEIVDGKLQHNSWPEYVYEKSEQDFRGMLDFIQRLGYK